MTPASSSNAMQKTFLRPTLNPGTIFIKVLRAIDNVAIMIAATDRDSAWRVQTESERLLLKTNVNELVGRVVQLLELKKYFRHRPAGHSAVYL